MAFCSEEIVAGVMVDGIVKIKEKEKILHCFREEEAFLPVLQAHIMNIMDCSISTPDNIIHHIYHFHPPPLLCSCVIIQAVEDVSPNMQVERVLCCPVQQVGGLY